MGIKEMESVIKNLWDYLNNYDRSVPFEVHIDKIIKMAKGSDDDPDWNEVEDINWETTVKTFKNQIEDNLPFIRKNKLKALYFGISNFAESETNTVHCCIEMGGSRQPNLERIDWYSEKDIYCESLDKIYRISNREDGLGNDLEYPVCLGITVIGIQQALSILINEKQLKPVYIEAGFHDGDLVQIIL